MIQQEKEAISRRQTRQRALVLEYLKSVKIHPTAETVYLHVVKQIPKITLATVYRNLNLLAEEGEILRLEINKEYRYDADISYHQHGVCQHCKKVFDFFQKNITMYALRKLDSKEFQPTAVEVIYKGCCKDCQNDCLKKK